MKSSFVNSALPFFLNLEFKQKLPGKVKVMNPYLDRDVRKVTKSFFNKFYDDQNERKLLLGINPGRFGAGVTGITFTDPVRLEKSCNIENEFDKRPELSSQFIYEMIEKFGGPEKFYKKFFLSAICPLGFTEDGKNVNYYDSPGLLKATKPFIINSLKDQLGFNVSREKCICIGTGKNFKFLSEINEEHGFFKKIIPLDHPRYIMQYKRKKKGEYLNKYLEVLSVV